MRVDLRDDLKCPQSLSGVWQSHFSERPPGSGDPESLGCFHSSDMQQTRDTLCLLSAAPRGACLTASLMPVLFGVDDPWVLGSLQFILVHHTERGFPLMLVAQGL